MASSPPTNPATSAKSTPNVKTISNPRRLLILSPTSQSISIIPPLLTSLTGTPIQNPPQQNTKTNPPDDASPNPETSPPTTTTTTTTFAGYTTHAPLSLSTKYYTAEIPLWVDEIPLETTPQTSEPATETATPTAEQWKTEFLSPEAEIVRDAVGALVVCVHTPHISSAPAPNPNPDADAQGDADPANRPDVRALLTLMRNIGAVKERIDEERGGVGDVPGVFVLVGKKGVSSGVGSGSGSGSGSGNRDADELALGVDDGDLGGEDVAPFSVGWWEDQFYDIGLLGWEVVEWDPKGEEGETRNMYGEREGMPRIKEVLETHDWSASGGSGGLGYDGEHDPDMDSEDDLQDQLLGLSSGQTRGFGDEVHELEREMFGLRMAIERGGGDGFEDEEEGGNGDDELDVESMEALMMRMQAIKDMSSELPEDQRKRFAAKAVQDIMREL
ncbi:hypothetical protein N7499_011528 [Penicillium canescens]|nr:hypothetical protein N7499_011528 [Penicillium canescens]KAJ6182307.1 hypothetical protein N7485_000949 [Penicillium canescens]